MKEFQVTSEYTWLYDSLGLVDSVRQRCWASGLKQLKE